MLSIHLNSIGFSPATVLFIVIIARAWNYSLKTCLRKELYLFCPCCLKPLSQERVDRHERADRERESPSLGRQSFLESSQRDRVLPLAKEPPAHKPLLLELHELHKLPEHPGHPVQVPTPQHQSTPSKNIFPKQREMNRFKNKLPDREH